MKKTSPSDQKKKIPIVAIGASAGGLEAVTELLKNLQADTGMAFIYVQHMDPDHKSLLTEILSRHTKMKVLPVKNALPVLGDHFYVSAPDKNITISRGVLKLKPRNSKPKINMPVDTFFMSLAENQKHSVIGVLLSGNANDGTQGLKAIKNAGGLTFVQDDTAKFKSMPASAIAEGVVDKVLAPKEIAEELVRISKNAGIITQAIIKPEDEDDKQFKNEELNEFKVEDLTGILQLLKNFSGVDFKHYKQSTIRRRIIRRMLLQKFDSAAKYINFLKRNPGEVSDLYYDLLINVTSFFRDHNTLKYFTKNVLPSMIRGRAPNHPLRIWVPACSTGEEAYSLAIVITEVLREKALDIPVQIFATDLCEPAISKARQGIYSHAELADISPERMKLFFSKVNGSYRIDKSIRDLCIFATQNVFSDPPFTKVDLISCCNLMIYLDTVLQKKILSIFHYALNKDGHLILGKSETIGNSGHFFLQLNKKHKVYKRKKDALEKKEYRALELDHTKKPPMPASKEKEARGFQTTVAEILLSKYVAASVVVNNDFEILHLHGPVNSFLKLNAGKASLNLLKVASPDLSFELRTILHKVRKSGRPEKKTGIEIHQSNVAQSIAIEVTPIRDETEERLFLVVFKKEYTASEKSKSPHTTNKHINTLKQELESTKKEMHSLLEEQQTMVEELQSANEEVVSRNEELQSINEELETSKEEIESANEELTIVNNEMQVKNAQLTESYEYIEAIFDTLREPLLILNKDLRIESANRIFYKTFRTSEKETEGTIIFELGNQQWNIPDLRYQLENVITKNSSFENFEVSFSFPTIGERIMLLNARKVIQKTQKKQSILVAFQDVTEQRKAQKLIANQMEELNRIVDERTEELRKINADLTRSNEELQQFAFIASHDLQEPLRKIITFIDRIQNVTDPELSQAGREYFNKVIGTSKRMRNLIDDLLNFSSIYFSEKKLEHVDLNKTLNDVLANLDPLIVEKKARITSEKLPVVEAVSFQMTQLFQNILTNALKFAKTDVLSVIKISSHLLSKQEIATRNNLEKNLRYVQISFSDNGIGFESKYAKRIFGIFTRLNNPKHYNGTGIGLALCSRIVSNHKGEIYAEPNGDGATFHVILPLK